MKAEYEMWSVSKGKGDRVYVKCNEEAVIMHPEELTKQNGLGLYGLEILKSLAVAIIKYERITMEANSIIRKAEELTND